MKKDLLVPAVAKKTWSIPQSLTKEPNRTRLVEMLASINKINDTTSYYIRDSYERKIIVDSSTSAILCGYQKEVAEMEGFAFYKRIFIEKEWNWLEKMFEETYKVFYSYPPAKRKHLVSNYDFTVQTINAGSLVLRHKGVPLLLCDNGNLWLSLCSVTVSAQKRSDNATVTNTETGEQHVYTNGRYILSDEFAITQNDLLILELMRNDLSTEQIIAQLDISLPKYRRKRQMLFDKLNVKNVGGAVYKAGLMGLF